MLIDDNGHAVRADFQVGLAVLVDATVQANSSNRHGSYPWMAPELHDPDFFGLQLKRTMNSDMYAFGCLFIEVRRHL